MISFNGFLEYLATVISNAFLFYDRFNRFNFPTEYSYQIACKDFIR